MSDREFQSVDLPGRPSLNCLVSGSGDIPVIFIHGYSLSLDEWERVLPYLPARYTGYAYDLRGFGRSGRGAQYTLEDHTADLTALMETLEIAKAVLVGHSLGANIAQMFAVAFPHRVTALVLSNCPARNLPAPDPVEGRVRERMTAYGTVQQNRSVLEGKMAAYFAPRNVTPEELDRFVEIGARADTKALRQTLEGLYSHPVIGPEQFAGLRVPVLAVWGDADEVTPINVIAPICDVLPQTKLLTIKGSGHTPMWEKPEEWSRAVYGFLDEML